MINFKMIQKTVIQFIDSHTRKNFDVDNGKLKHIPNLVIFLVYIMCMSVIFQGVADVLIKVIGYTPFMERLPWRVDFLFLTVISVLMGCQALIGMRRRELDVTRNSVQIGLFVEAGLIVGDIVFLLERGELYPQAIFIRMPFIVLTSINVLIFLYLVKRLDLFRDGEGNWRLF